mmetsp:Transcript_94960/g.188091  ORF Transcript_94960/g.188091 Transcript_94960/m.188091 type:complete len:437 (-) Transcript_94960:443-1753(-)|eukprot:CAMPEP_0172674018 /NCGR_PEP_ID=MMETSP1074-20121228/12503_1 /TAXON_ID=2916 /ORGANISM="Ceratium fusus, Strain PA161109" /LENGTH=436 /DNA_ID=CAMNT_0013491393 /DNA_START=35 /DNA_END=1345 /DNA_ORIENTATION=-
MAENETKLRRAAGSGPSAPQYAPIPAAEALECAGKVDDAGIKGHNSRCLQLRASLLRLLHRRGVDIAAMIGYFVANLLIHRVVLFLLCDPESPVVEIFRPLFLLVSFLFNCSWLGVVYHGPDWAPPVNSEEPAAAARLPPALAAALEVGRLGSKQQFNAEVITCSKCDRPKSPFSHHCNKCNRCVAWMDQHCALLGTCIGFRNMRCYIVWLSYGTPLTWTLIVLTLHKLYQDGLPQSWRWCVWGPWFWLLGNLHVRFNLYLRYLLMQIGSGYHSHVMVQKFRDLHRDGVILHEEIQARIAALPMAAPGSEGRPLHEARLLEAGSELSQAVQNLRTGISNGHNYLLWGPFMGDRLWANLPMVFGSEYSWRWLLPLVPGGTGDPFQPASWNPKGCSAWTQLGAAMESCREALKVDGDASGALQLQIEAFIGGHDAFCA